MIKNKMAAVLIVVTAFFLTPKANSGGIYCLLSTQYMELRTELANDNFEKAHDIAKYLVATVGEILPIGPGDPDTLKVILQKLVEGAKQLANSTEEKDVRTAFGTISEQMMPLVKFFKFTADWEIFFCPKTKTYPYWLQMKHSGPEIGNPYLGLKKPHCAIPVSWDDLENCETE